MPVSASPLRYPGGKTKLYSVVKPIIARNIAGECTYIEPFAGGAGLALKLLFCGDVQRLILNDIDENIYSVWMACLTETDELCRLIDDCNPTIDEWTVQKQIYLNPRRHALIERAFATLFLNRCNVSGVINGGPIGGKGQTGRYKIDARFVPESLKKRIRLIGENRDRITFHNLEASYFLEHVVARYPIDNVFINIDPPYIQKGPMLYQNSFSINDHVALSQVIRGLDYKWITTYDFCDTALDLYKDYHCDIITLPYSTGNAKTGMEYLFYSNNLI